jgi:glycosyltransferase involved in cell wall biosynthesis
VKSRLIINATNVHQGGGKSLLSALLGACHDNLNVVALLDRRMIMPSNIAQKVEIRFIPPSIWQRLKAEWWLRYNVQPQDIVICFGNLPPLFKLHGHVTVFVQNRYLVDRVSLTKFPFKTKLRLVIERLWFSGRVVNADDFVVQTSSMKKALLSSGCVVKQPVHIRPFTILSGGYQRKSNHQNTGNEHKRYDFIYTASGEPHKNHRRLIEAWCFLAEQGLFPSLCLTLDKNISPELCDWVEEQKLRYGLKLDNVGYLPHDQILEMYAQARALIYPSTFESFGLPLIEARQAGLPIVASEMDFIRDVIDPDQSFDPNSSVSISRAVKRYLGMDEFPLQLLDAEMFLHNLLESHR